MPDVDPLIAEVVETVGNRFGAEGLNEMIALAQLKRADAEAALEELAALAPA